MACRVIDDNTAGRDAVFLALPGASLTKRNKGERERENRGMPSLTAGRDGGKRERGSAGGGGRREALPGEAVSLTGGSEREGEGSRRGADIAPPSHDEMRNEKGAAGRYCQSHGGSGGGRDIGSHIGGIEGMEKRGRDRERPREERERGREKGRKEGGRDGLREGERGREGGGRRASVGNA